MSCSVLYLKGFLSVIRVLFVIKVQITTEHYFALQKTHFQYNCWVKRKNSCIFPTNSNLIHKADCHLSRSHPPCHQQGSVRPWGWDWEGNFLHFWSALTNKGQVSAFMSLMWWSESLWHMALGLSLSLPSSLLPSSPLLSSLLSISTQGLWLEISIVPMWLLVASVCPHTPAQPCYSFLKFHPCMQSSLLRVCTFSASVASGCITVLMQPENCS